MNDLDAVSFNAATFSFDGDRPNVRVWHSAEGDGIGLYYFPKPPDLPAGAGSISDLRAFYNQMTSKSNARVVEVVLSMLDGCRGIRTILKVPQSPTGLTYLGSLTIPFRDFSFVVKIQCEERGPTGLRDAVLLDKALAEKKVTVNAAGMIEGNWSADDAQYDSLFPQHPLSRLRRMLDQIQPSIRIVAKTKAAPAFVLPAK